MGIQITPSEFTNFKSHIQEKPAEHPTVPQKTQFFTKPPKRWNLKQLPTTIFVMGRNVGLYLLNGHIEKKHTWEAPSDMNTCFAA